MTSPKLVDPDRDEDRDATTPWVSEESGGRVCFSAAGWFRHSRSLALTSWLNQHPVNKPRCIKPIPEPRNVGLFIASLKPAQPALESL